MKKFISMVMAAAMVVSLVPATAFAANTATFKVVDAVELTEEAADQKVKTDLDKIVSKTEIQIKLTEVDNNYATEDKYDITLSFDNVEAGNDVVFSGATGTQKTWSDMDLKTINNKNLKLKLDSAVDAEDDSFEFVLVTTENLVEDDVITIDVNELATKLGLVYTDDADATVEVDGDFGTSDAMTIVSVLEEGIKVTLKKVGEVAEEETKALKSNLVVEANVDKFIAKQVIELKLNSGFEFDFATGYADPAGLDLNETESEDDCLVYDVVTGYAKYTFENLMIDAVDAKVGDVAKITVKAKEGTAAKAFKDTVTVDAMEVIGETVTMSVEEDEDVPVFYSGVKANNNFLNDDEDHMSLEVTIEESVAGALDVKKDLELMLTEGVYVTNVTVTGNKDVEVTVDGATYTSKADIASKAFKAAYEEGEHKGFVFDRKTFTETEKAEAMELSFKLELIAVPGFEGDVVLTMDGAAFEDAQEVTIAKFVAPYTVEASQNDLIIDYRNTEVPTDIVVTEAEAGLWNADAMAFYFSVDYMDFEDDAVFAVNEESEMEITEKGQLGFIVDEESDEEAAVVTINGIKLYMSRSLAAGAYDLELSTPAGYEMMTTPLFTTEKDGALGAGKYAVADIADWDTETVIKEVGGVDTKVTQFAGEAGTAKEAFINIITAGRDQDDASFTKKVVVTIGANEMVAGEDTVALEVPAYINAAGRTMLPVRAVAVALGINTNNVIWDQPTKTVTILYGQRIITMQVGSSVITVNGSAIPASAAVEIVNGRTFLGFRDLATALGVTDIVWTAETQQVTLNGGK